MEGHLEDSVRDGLVPTIVTIMIRNTGCCIGYDPFLMQFSVDKFSNLWFL